MDGVNWGTPAYQDNRWGRENTISPGRLHTLYSRMLYPVRKHSLHIPAVDLHQQPIEWSLFNRVVKMMFDDLAGDHGLKAFYDGLDNVLI